MADFREALAKQVLILDGAMGTMLQERGLAPGGCPEAMNESAPEVVVGIHREYVEAGADIIVTNTFGGSSAKLGHYGLQDRVYDLNARAVELARQAAGHDRFVAGSIGPTGRFLTPVGDADFDEMVAVFGEQVRAFAEAGADLVTMETFLDIRELRAAVIAAREFSSLPIVAQMTFDDGGRSVLGTPPEAAAVTLDALGVDVIGSNCGLGIDGIYALLEKMRAVTSRPLISQANAGLPELRNGVTVFPGTPEEMTAYHDRLLAIGVRIIGGCCGTTPHPRPYPCYASGFAGALDGMAGAAAARLPFQSQHRRPHWGGCSLCRDRRAHQSYRQEKVHGRTARGQDRLYPSRGPGAGRGGSYPARRQLRYAGGG